MSSSRPIAGRSGQRSSSVARSPFSRSWRSSSPVAQEAIARDLEDDDEEAEEEDNLDDEEDSETSTVRASDQHHTLSSSYRRPSFVAYGAARPTTTPKFKEVSYLTKQERRELREEERSLLRDNHLAPPKHSQPAPSSAPTKIWKQLFSPRRPREEDEESGEPSSSVPTETTALLGNGASDAIRPSTDRQWEEAVAAGKIKTTWQREAKVLTVYSRSLVVTFVLQYSLTVASIFTVGHLGKIELGAVSLASMTANITGYAIYQGLSTSLDTLCAQAYGCGKKHLVGLQFQRMVWFLWTLTIPIAIVWFFADKILLLIVPEKESAELAGLYLRILILGAPGYSLFESGKRFLQAQGLFSATTYCLLIAAPLNALMNYLFVWKFGWGFVGAPIAVAITDNLLPLLLFLYVYFVDGKQCWGGFTKRALRNWGPMIKLALPGLVMVLAEWLAFEILTLASSYFSSAHLAAQSILSTIGALMYQIPFPLSIAASTRVANLIGATLSDAAKTSSKVALIAAVLVGLLNVTILSSLRQYLPQLFTNDPEVIELCARVLPIVAAYQLFDSLSACCSGLLRGLGRQEIGGYVNLFCYYVIAMPISFGTGFGLGWKLEGLWCGVALALLLVAVIEAWFLHQTSWDRAVQDAQDRNNAN